MKKLIAHILRWQAKRFIRKNKPKIVGVVGSVGKTSTTQAVATVLSEKFKVRATIKSYNTDLGVPCTIFHTSLPEQLTDPFAWLKIFISHEKSLHSSSPIEVLVLELGTDRPGDLQIFSWLPIDICVVTAIADEHMEYFGTLEAVASEELSIAAYSKKLLINKRMVDEQYVSSLEQAKVAYYDRGELESFAVAPTDLQVIGEHSFDAVVAALKVGSEFGMDKEALKAGAGKIVPQPGRMSKLVGLNQSVLIDDTYNASPKAVTAALDYLYSVQAPKKMVLLGNMNELGESSPESHQMIGAYCDPHQLSLVVTLGPDANMYTAPAAEAKGCVVKQAATPYEAAALLKEAIVPGAYILLKGSQNRVFAEEAVKELLANPADISKIVRQSPFWLKKKKANFKDVR